MSNEVTKQEPVAWISHSDSLLSWDKLYDHMQPLYTVPPQPKPLTDREIGEVLAAVLMQHSANLFYPFARAIEAAHGIK